VWPNPTTEYFRIGLEAPAGRYCLLMLHDLSGRLLQTVPIPEGTLVYTVSLEGVPEGMCMLSVTEAGKVLGREKLVVQRF
jgi:hypothetical protein